MRAVIQRVSRAAVRVEGRTIGEIGRGLLVLLCAMQGDTETDVQFMARKLATLRIFPDEQQKLNRSVQDVGGGILLVSQFTLAADTSSGTRPSFSGAAPAAEGQRLVEDCVALLRTQGLTVATGEFGASMEVELVNMGPVTIQLDSRNKV
jgi:D-aminoacyl-tRNA deacylase